MENKVILSGTINTLSALEEIQRKVEHLEGLAQVCANGFTKSGSLGDISEKDLENSFLSFKDQAREIGDGIQGIIQSIMDSNR